MQPLSELIKEAAQMLRDRSQIERDIIYAVCKLDDKERTAIILAYKMLYESLDE